MEAQQFLQTAPQPTRYARGWHCLGHASDYKDGKPHRLDIFGTRLVAFAGEDGRIRILDAWCPHMGADLALGEVKGNAIVCRFHCWHWNGDGACEHVPCAKRIPPKARTRAWTVCEQNHLLFIWHDPEGAPPPPAVAVPRISACFTGEWTGWTIRKMVIGTHCRELVVTWRMSPISGRCTARQPSISATRSTATSATRCSAARRASCLAGVWLRTARTSGPPTT